ncbi:lipid A-modifier LpxR family protein [Thermodesulfobacteriota bacterium]
MRGAGNIPPTCQCWTDTRKASPRFGIHLYGGANGHVVARNIILDGNTFRESPRVDREPVFGGVEFGAAIVMRRLKVSFTSVVDEVQHEFVLQLVVPPPGRPAAEKIV